MRVLEPGYEDGMVAYLQPGYFRGTMILEPGYEGVKFGVRVY